MTNGPAHAHSSQEDLQEDLQQDFRPESALDLSTSRPVDLSTSRPLDLSTCRPLDLSSVDALGINLREQGNNTRNIARLWTGLNNLRRDVGTSVASRIAALNATLTQVRANVATTVASAIAAVQKAVPKNGAAIGALSVVVDADKGEKAPACAAGSCPSEAKY